MPVLGQVLGESAPIAAVREQVARLLRSAGTARRLPPVLILGETGTGKGLLADAIHAGGHRAAGPFIDVNCAAIPETLLEAELFGFERGAFTDARQAKPGLFQAAGGGTIFLDEVGLLPPTLQSKLLKVIEEREVRRLGSTRSEPVDVSIVAATSEDLAAATQDGRFRADLYHRLAVFTLLLPPLRTRGRDVIVLAEEFLGRVCEDYGLPLRVLTDDARAALLAYPWPGNVRELANVLERAAVLSDEPKLTAAHLGLPAATPADIERAADGGDDDERRMLRDVLQANEWNFTRAAARLGLPRNTLRYRAERLGLVPDGPERRRGGRPPAPGRALEPATPRAPATRHTRRVTLLQAKLVPAAPPGWETSRRLEESASKIRSFGGQVEDLGPGALLAVFGLEPDEDAPRRATYAALAVQTLVARAGGDAAEAPQLTVALHTQVPLALLRAVTGRAEAALGEDLRRLQNAEFLRETRVFPEVEFAFKHALTQDVAYGRVEPDRRRILHARITEAIEELHRDRLDEHVERLAYHAARGEHWERAVRYARQAGAKALDRSAPREAVASFEAALAALARLPEGPQTLAEAIDVRLAARAALLQLGELQRVERYLREAEALATTLGDRRRLGWVWTFRAVAHLFVGNPGEAAAVAERARTIGHEIGDVVLRATALTPLAHAHSERGDYRRAIALYAEAIEALGGDLARERLGHAVPPSIYARSMTTICLAELGEFAEAERSATEAATLTRTHDLPSGFVLARMALGHVALLRGRIEDAMQAMEPALETIEARGIPTWQPWAAALRGYALALAGCLEEGRALLELALERDLVEFVAHDANDISEKVIGREDAMTAANSRLEREHSAYRFIAGELAPITNPAEIGEIERAAEAASKSGLSGVREHIEQALNLFGKRPEPDYRNAIKEAISAVEGAVKLIEGVRSGGLKDALDALAKKADIHPALRDGLVKIYGFTSDAAGIRHPLLDAPTVGEEDARFMIVTCSAFVNFLIAKADTAGLLKK